MDASRVLELIQGFIPCNRKNLANPVQQKELGEQSNTEREMVSLLTSSKAPEQPSLSELSLARKNPHGCVVAREKGTNIWPPSLPLLARERLGEQTTSSTQSRVNGARLGLVALGQSWRPPDVLLDLGGRGGG